MAEPSPGKILAVSPNWLGDAVLSLPSLAGLARLYPKATVHILARNNLADLFRNLPTIAQVVGDPLQGIKLGNLIHQLKEQKYDLAVLFPNSFRSAYLAWQAGIPARMGYRADGRGLLLTLAVPRPKGWQRMHQADYYFHLLGVLGPCGRPEQPRIIPDLKDSRWAQATVSQLARDQAPLVVLNPGAAYGPTKRWFPERFVELARQVVTRLGGRVAIVGSLQEGPLAAGMKAQIGPEAVSLAGRTSLGQLAALARASAVFVTNDSGPMHLAAAAGAKVVAIFGSTDPGKTAPLGHHQVVLRQPFPCSPCFKRVCPENYQCLAAITVAQVFEEVQRAIQATR